MLKHFFALLIIQSLFYTIATANENDLTLNTSITFPFPMKNSDRYLDEILIEAFKRINKTVHIVEKPAERSIKDTNEGRGDGEFIRVAGLSKIYPNIIQVPEEILKFEFVAFTKRKNITIKEWEDLSHYNVGIIIGWKILEKNIKKSYRRHSFPEPKHMFKMLEKDRITIAVYSKHMGLKVINELGYNNINVISPPLTVQPMYLYLHKKHKKLVPLLVQSLKSMKEDGIFQKIGDEN